MLEHKKIRSLDDYFVDLNGRQSREVYFLPDQWIHGKNRGLYKKIL